MLDTVRAERHGGIQLVRCHRNAVLVSEVDHPLLQQVRQPHVGLQEVVSQDAGALELPIELRSGRETEAAGIENPRAVERVAGCEHPWSDTRPGGERLAVLDRIVGTPRRYPHRGDAVGEEDPTQRFAELLVEMGVHLDQSGHHRCVRSVYDLVRVTMALVPVRLDRNDSVAGHHQVHVGLQEVMDAVKQATGMHDRAAGRTGRLPPQIDRQVTHARGVDRHQPQSVGRLIEQRPAVTRPAR